MTTQKSVIVGLSGGVDSAVAACLLIEQGYRVTGLNIRVLDTPEEDPVIKPSAMRVSDLPKFSFPVFTLNLSGKFRKDVILYFHDDYLSGRTPNPCMVCNRKIKWFGLSEGARLLGAETIATGHYAGTAYSNGRYRLFKGDDPLKDQSYFLWMLSQEDLAKTLFPLAGYSKQQVRELARSFGVRAAEKKESQEICFVPHDDYCSYLANAIPELAEKVAGGDIVDDAGRVLGKHRGYPFYTIGQRRGLGISAKEPLYVTAIDAEHNRIQAGTKESLESRRLIASGMNWIGLEKPAGPFEAVGKIRYRDREAPCTIEPLDDDGATVTFSSIKNAVTTGQAVVFYRENEVLGGGIITGVIKESKQ
jgi:tRNA-specific 2-thiouridylase